MSESIPRRLLMVGVANLRDHESALSAAEFLLDWVDTVEDAHECLERDEPAIMIVRVGLAGHREFCRTVVNKFPAIEILLAGPASDVAADQDFVSQSEVDVLAETTVSDVVTARVRRAWRHRLQRLELVELRKQITNDHGFGGILGTSAAMQTVFELVNRAATTNASVLITGESGTGKELVASALHQCGTRRDRPFVAINCSAMPEALLESELFGHVKGAFTDARDARAGLFAKATGGTLFLDEIGDMPLSLQPKLLRALQERVVRPVGSDRELPIDVRIVAATNRDLEDAAEKRLFREDLFYRLNVIHIEIPPLRERSGDILLLAEHFARTSAKATGKHITGISRPAAIMLLRYGWPGNVRELQNCVERSIALCEDEVICVSDLPAVLREPSPGQFDILPTGRNELVTLEVLERRYIEHVLKILDGNKRATARALGLDRKTLYRRLEKYGIPTTESPTVSENESFNPHP